MTSARVPQCLLSFPPVVHPSYLEGDHSLATEILPGPPSLESIRQLSKKIEPKKVPAPSYLPLTDPGSTYIGFAGGMAAMAPDEIGPRRKRARMDKGLSHRAQRASARHIVDAPFFIDEASNSEPDAASSQPGPDDIATFNDEDRSTSHSRSASVQLNGDTPDQSVSSKSNRKTGGKGKGKEKAATQVRVKEEPIALQLSDIPVAPANEDHCSSCSSFGALVYCDSCPRAFHLWCLDPPMDPSIFPDGEESWYCPGCKLDQAPPPKPSHSFLSPLIDQLHNEIPTEFCLPEEIRTYFRDVGTGPGGMYIDNSSSKAIRIGRHGLGEERDPYRLKDNRGAPIICFHCGKSALPDDPAVGPSTKGPRHASINLSDSEHWKSIISCDFCPLHWHVDCLEPPLTSLPPFNRKWKCPNHASSSLPKLRIPKTAPPPIDITDIHQRNNGNIEVINSETPTRSEDKILVDEVLINGRKYRVPERIIVLDFWGKVKQHRSRRLRESDSIESSPLTSLSSLDDRPTPLQLDDRILDSDEESLQIAGLLCQLKSIQPGTQHQNPPINRPTQRRGHVRMVRQTSDRANPDFAATLIRNKHGSQGKEKDVSAHTRPATHTILSSKRSGMNGARPSRSTRITVPHTSSYYGPKTGKFASSLNGTQAIHDTKAKEFGSNLNSKRSTGLEALVARSTLSNEAMGTKPSTSPLKIRIPSRILQKQSSSSISAGEPGHVPPTISSLQIRPRRSLRRQSSVNGTGSECSLSTDRGYDGRS